MNIDDLISSYPRKRPPMSPAMTEVFERIYKENRYRDSWVHKISEWLEAWMHRRVAQVSGKKILEIGAGTLNHLKYVRNSTEYDIVEPFKEMYENSPGLSRINSIYSNINELDISKKYDKIISIATLEHVTDLPYCIGMSARHLEKSGVFQAGIPSEGGLLWGLSWRISTGLAFRLKTGLDWSEYMTHEHINDAHDIMELVQYVFDEVRISRFPLPSHHLSWYVYIEARSPRLEVFEKILNT